MQLAFMLIGCMLIIVEFRLLQTRQRFLQKAYRAVGTVIDKRQVWWGTEIGILTMYTTTILFVSNPGTIQELRTSLKKLAVGEEIIVLYNPVRPQQAIVASTLSMSTAMTIFLIFLGSLFLIMGIAL